MEACAKSVSIIKQPVNDRCSNSLRINISIRQILDGLLFIIKPVAEYALGMHIGFAFGWLFGLVAGHIYVKHFEPVYLDDLNQLPYWTAAPNVFAGYGALTGLIIGVIAILVINGKLLNQRVITLCEEGVDNPNEVARLLDKSIGQIKRKMNKLAKTGKIGRKVNSPGR
jgi:hypothetical protein